MNKNTSKLLCLLLALVLCLSVLAGCGGNSNNSSNSNSSGNSNVVPPAPDKDPDEGSDPAPEKIVYTIDNIRQYVIGVDEPVELGDGTKQPLINFDNAATTPSLKPVTDAVVDEMKMYGSIGRGFSQKSNHSTDVYQDARETVLNFVNADPDEYTCFYVNSTTDGLNKLASALVESPDDLVLATRIEVGS